MKALKELFQALADPMANYQWFREPDPNMWDTEAAGVSLAAISSPLYADNRQLERIGTQLILINVPIKIKPPFGQATVFPNLYIYPDDGRVRYTHEERLPIELHSISRFQPRATSLHIVGMRYGEIHTFVLARNGDYTLTKAPANIPKNTP